MSAALQELWERIEARDWDGARACLHPEATLHYPHTGERFTGAEAIVAINAEYPEGWTVEIDWAGATDAGEASRVTVVQGADRFVAATFFTLREGRLADGVELWVTEGAEAPPAWRGRFAT